VCLEINKVYYPGLTSLRIIAALMVYLHHFNPLPKGFILFGIPIWGILNEFHIGVTIFFVLSGFLIASRYMDAKVRFKKYLWNRFVRIYPIYFLLTLLTFIAASTEGISIYSLKIFLLNITFLRGFFDNYKFSLIDQGWSLTVEETFYIIAPIIFILLKKYGNIIYLTPSILIIVGIFISNISYSTGFWGDVNFSMNYTFFGRSVEFFTGIYTATYVNKQNNSPNMVFANPWFGAFNAFILVWIMHILSLLNGCDFGIRLYSGMIINTILIPFFVVVPLILSFTLYQGKYTIFESNFMQILGKASYVFYLIHMGIFRDFYRSIGISNELLLFLILIFTSVLLWKFIEEPIHKKYKQLIIG
jgi:peptidoglycan/LPS O-acetylase OafA/YrhL